MALRAQLIGRTRRASVSFRRCVAGVGAAVAVAALVCGIGGAVDQAKAFRYPASNRLTPRNRVTSRAVGLLDGVTRIAEDLQDTFEDSFGNSEEKVLPQMQVSSLEMANGGISRGGLIETMSIQAKMGSERRVARRLARFAADAQESGATMSAVVTQSEEDQCQFTVLLRYRSEENLLDHQGSNGAKEILEQLEEYLDRPIGLYMMDEQMGQIGMARHPFGPGGEGGRDDAIYSSRKS
mmetsp:Transcript_41115/g.94581  ORF Transcript_41115/g.94581 Transcript_41115/m.94581 type:complete len:238 (-) Transcript_41115:89-802(-)